MDCYYCLSIWLAIPFAFMVADRNWSRLVSWLALSGAASLLERATRGEKRGPQSSHPMEEEP